MKTIEKILEEYPNTRLWEDNKTLDYELPESQESFTKQLIKFKCPSCDGSIIDGNQDILRGLPKTIKGAQLTCNKCKLPLFIHELVVY